MTTPPLDLTVLRGLMERADIRPWSFDGPRSNIHIRESDDPDMRVCFMTSDGPARARAALIVTLVNHLPEILAMLEAGQRVRDEALEEAARICDERVRADQSLYQSEPDWRQPYAANRVIRASMDNASAIRALRKSTTGETGQCGSALPPTGDRT